MNTSLFGSISRSDCAPDKRDFFNFAEYYFGEIGAGKETAAIRFLDSFNLLPLTKESSKAYANLRHKYKIKRAPLASIDLFIAAIAIENNATLITTDKDFERVEELKTIVVSPQ